MALFPRGEALARPTEENICQIQHGDVFLNRSLNILLLKISINNDFMEENQHLFDFIINFDLKSVYMYHMFILKQLTTSFFKSKCAKKIVYDDFTPGKIDILEILQLLLESGGVQRRRRR